MEHSTEVFYVSAEQQFAHGGTPVRQMLAKFFSREAADAHAKVLSSARNHYAVEVTVAVEAWKDQDISHRPG